MAILETIAIKGLTAFSTKLVSKCAEVGWNRLAEEFQASLTVENLKSFCKACDEYVNIRTLYSSQHDVFIDDVYVPLFMSPSNDSKNIIEITQLSFYTEGITNIIGKAGQGKSTFMRKMLINELQHGKAIPIFFELKYLDENTDLLSQIAKWLKRHNLELNAKGINRLLRDGKIKVFLDGFDEMPPSSHDNALGKIKDFSRAYPRTTVIVTTRPDTLITTEPFISNYNVLDLTLDNIQKLFMNISDNNTELTEDAMKQLRNHSRIRDIAKTPILAILLFITYRAWSKIPDNLSDFYKKIFITLLTHHDSLKSGKKIDRGIDIPLNDYQIEDVFSIFCFRTFSEGQDSFSKREAIDYMRDALNNESYEDVCPENLLEVIKRCTGIICNNGYDTLTFSHKSLQEYYTALYIKDQSINDKRNFYKSIVDQSPLTKYSSVMKFLCGIDTVHYAKYYYVPIFQQMFNVNNVKTEIDITTIEYGLNKIIDSVVIPFRKSGMAKNGQMELGLRLEIDSEENGFFYIKFLQPIILGLIQSDIYINYKNENESKIQSHVDGNEEYGIPLNEILNSRNEEELLEFNSFLKKCFDEVVTNEHSYLITRLNKKKKPSLLNQAFRKPTSA